MYLNQIKPSVCPVVGHTYYGIDATSTYKVDMFTKPITLSYFIILSLLKFVIWMLVMVAWLENMVQQGVATAALTLARFYQ